MFDLQAIPLCRTLFTDPNRCKGLTRWRRNNNKAITIIVGGTYRDAKRRTHRRRAGTGGAKTFLTPWNFSKSLGFNEMNFVHILKQRKTCFCLQVLMQAFQEIVVIVLALSAQHVLPRGLDTGTAPLFLGYGGLFAK